LLAMETCRVARRRTGAKQSREKKAVSRNGWLAAGEEKQKKQKKKLVVLCSEQKIVF